MIKKRAVLKRLVHIQEHLYSALSDFDKRFVASAEMHVRTAQGMVIQTLEEEKKKLRAEYGPRGKDEGNKH